MTYREKKKPLIRSVPQFIIIFAAKHTTQSENRIRTEINISIIRISIHALYIYIGDVLIIYIYNKQSNKIIISIDYPLKCIEF